MFKKNDNNKVDTLAEAEKHTYLGGNRSGISGDGVRQVPGGVKMINAIQLSNWNTQKAWELLCVPATHQNWFCDLTLGHDP